MLRTRLNAALAAALSATLTVGASAAATSPASITQPPAPERPVTEDHFGTKITDPYRWLENVKDPAVMQWLNSQAQYTDQALARIPGRDAVRKQMQQLSETSGDSIGDVAQRAGDVRFIFKRGAQADQFMLYVKTGNGAERVLVDTDQLQKTTGKPHAINYFVPSWDAKYVAYGLSEGGSEQADLHILEVASGRELIKPITRANGGGLTTVVWTPDSKAVLFNRLKQYPASAPPEAFYKNSSVYSLAVALPAQAPKPVFGASLLPALKLAALDFASMTTSPDSSWVIATINDTTDLNYQVWSLPLAKLGHADAPWHRIATVPDGVANVVLHGDDLYLLSHSGAPNFRILKLDLKKSGVFKDAMVVVPEQAGAISDFTAGADALYLDIRDAFNLAIWRAPFDGGTPGAAAQLTEVKLPITGSDTLFHDDAHLRAGVLASATSWTEGTRGYEWSPGGGAHEVMLRDRGTFNEMNDLEVTNVEVPTADGAKVPLAIIAKKGLVLDGSHPALVYGYGSYGFTAYDPAFSTNIRVWTAHGGVFAVAGARGGGERGDAWHLAGAKQNKPNTWKDGIACAEYLVAHKYTAPARLAAMGGSAGGIFAGRILTTRPDLFRAVVIQVGMTDTLRSEFSANGATNVSEFGTVADAEGFRNLLAMSTYANIKDGTAYPAVLLTHGLNDPRVDIWQSLKTTARLQKASSSGRPVLLRVEREAGHGIGSTRSQQLNESADTEAFLLWQMEAAGFQSPSG